jgi:hypothetical protein
MSHNLKDLQQPPINPLETVPYKFRQETSIIGTLVAEIDINCLGTSVSIPKKDSCSLVYAATGPLSPGRRFFYPLISLFNKKRNRPFTVKKPGRTSLF